MTTTLYITISAIHYFLGAIPEHRLQEDAPPYRNEAQSRLFGERFVRGMRRMGKWVFWAETANFAVCCALFLLKCVGVLAWW